MVSDVDITAEALAFARWNRQRIAREYMNIDLIDACLAERYSSRAVRKLTCSREN